MPSTHPSRIARQEAMDAAVDLIAANSYRTADTVLQDANSAALLSPPVFPVPDIISTDELMADVQRPKEVQPDIILTKLDSSRRDNTQEFRDLVRMQPQAFDRLLTLIEGHANFASGARSPKLQLAVFLYRMGRAEDNVRDIARDLGLCVGSVVDYSHNVAGALSAARSVLGWATEEEKSQSKDWVLATSGVPEWQHGFVVLDNFLIPMQYVPRLDCSCDPSTERHGLRVHLAILPHNLKIIECVVGGACDSQTNKIATKMHCLAKPLQHFKKGEWVWADSVYGVDVHILSPYSQAAYDSSVDFRLFNDVVSLITIRAKHAFAYLKGRFPACKELKHQIQDKDMYRAAKESVLAMLLAHNIALEHDAAGDYEYYTSAESGSPAASQASQDLQPSCGCQEDTASDLGSSTRS